MKYQRLEHEVYRNSRYALITLLDGNPCPFQMFNDIAQNYEQIIDSFVPDIPLSEERLTLFSMVYSGFDFSDALFKAAFVAGDRNKVWSYIRYRGKGNTTMMIDRCWYEAEIFGKNDGV